MILVGGGPGRTRSTLMLWHVQEPGWNVGHAGIGYYTYWFASDKDGSILDRVRLQNPPTRVGTCGRPEQVRLQHMIAKVKTGGGW